MDDLSDLEKLDFFVNMGDHSHEFETKRFLSGKIVASEGIENGKFEHYK